MCYKRYEIEYFIPEKYLDSDGYFEVEGTLQCAIIYYNVPNAKLKSKDKEVQNRINLYEKSKNLAVFLSPTKKEMEEW